MLREMTPERAAISFTIGLLVSLLVAHPGSVAAAALATVMMVRAGIAQHALAVRRESRRCPSCDRRFNGRICPSCGSP